MSNLISIRIHPKCNQFLLPISKEIYKTDSKAMHMLLKMDLEYSTDTCTVTASPQWEPLWEQHVVSTMDWRSDQEWWEMNPAQYIKILDKNLLSSDKNLKKDVCVSPGQWPKKHYQNNSVVWNEENWCPWDIQSSSDLVRPHRASVKRAQNCCPLLLLLLPASDPQILQWGMDCCIMLWL